MPTIAIIGAGQAGFHLAHQLRAQAFSGRVILIGDEGCAPYQRPPLSKAYLTGKMDGEGLAFRPDTFFVEHAIERLDASATAIDRAAKQVSVAGHAPVPYDILVLATGSRRRDLPVEGGTLDGVHGLATRADADRIKHALGQGRKQAVVIGAGFIGLEFAAGARHWGLNVTVVDIAERLMARAVSPAISTFFQKAHEASGVHFRLGTGVARLEGEGGHVRQVVTSGGEYLPADLVVAGIGVLPNDQLARDCGLAVDNGILVDEHLATSDPAIFAIGDCANFPDARLLSRQRLESVQNATDQARALATQLATGERIAYHAVPWFWSDQGPHKLQIAGLSNGATQFVEQEDSKGLSVFCFRDAALIAVETVDHGADHMAARRLFAGDLRRPTALEVAGEGFSLKDYVLAKSRVAAA